MVPLQSFPKFLVAVVIKTLPTKRKRSGLFLYLFHNVNAKVGLVLTRDVPIMYQSIGLSAEFFIIGISVVDLLAMLI